MARIDTLEPDFKEKVLDLLQATEEATGIKWMVTSARRTMAEQKTIYAQGRTTPGNIVTKAPPGYSAHNFGLAADLAPMKANGRDIDWGAPKSVWKVMADIAVDQGLVSGFYFKTIFDGPHVEDPKWKETQKLWLEGKLEVL